MRAARVHAELLGVWVNRSQSDLRALAGAEPEEIRRQDLKRVGKFMLHTLPGASLPGDPM
ncbi:hypothetical protein GCM10009795_096810 [Nocardioides hankookensis]